MFHARFPVSSVSEKLLKYDRTWTIRSVFFGVINWKSTLFHCVDAWKYLHQHQRKAR